MKEEIRELHGQYSDEYKYQVRKGFENEGQSLQYRQRGDGQWHDAYWCGWEWHKYDYRIKPELIKADEAVPVYPVLVVGKVFWCAKEALDAWDERKYSYERIKRFRTIAGVRHAIIERVQK